MITTPFAGFVRRRVRRAAKIWVALSALALSAPLAHAIPVYNAGTFTAGISFGVTDFTANVVANPTYIPNNLNGNTDILNNPGTPAVTDFHPTVANNIATTGFLSPGGAAPEVFLNWAGGSNANGSFGTGSIVTTPGLVGFALRDFAAGGVSGSYGVSAWNANFTDAAGTAAPGTWLAFGGTLPAVGTDAVASLRVSIDRGLNGVGVDYDLEHVLFLGRTGPATYPFRVVANDIKGNAVAGDSGGIIVVDDAAAGTFRGIVWNTLQDFGAGETLSVQAALTIAADPSKVTALDNLAVADLISDLESEGVSFPDFGLMQTQTTSLPLPPAVWLFAAGLAVLFGKARRRRAAA